MPAAPISNGSLGDNGGVKRVDLYIKVEVELDEAEDTEKVANEICRTIQKLYPVRSAELSSTVAKD